MASPVIDRFEFENLPSNIKISRLIKTPNGLKYRAVVTKNRVDLLSETPGGFTVVLTGPTVAELSVSGAISGLLDELASALSGLVGLLKKAGCTPTQTITQNFDKSGHIISQTITNTCVPN